MKENVSGRHKLLQCLFIKQKEKNFYKVKQIFILWVKWEVYILLLLFSHSVMFNFLWPHGLSLTRFLCPWDFPGKNPGVGCHFPLQGIFLA